MTDVVALFQNPWAIMLVVGLIAGWLAGLLLGGGGLIRNLVVGVLGAFLGGVLVRAGLLALPPAITDVTSIVPFGTQIFVSTIGAILIVIIARVFIR